MRILNTEFTSKTNEDGKKSWKVDGPLAGTLLLSPFYVVGALAFLIGRRTKR